jgi:hypothetical protein
MKVVFNWCRCSHESYSQCARNAAASTASAAIVKQAVLSEYPLVGQIKRLLKQQSWIAAFLD